MQTHLERFIRFLAAEKGLSTAYQLSVRQTLEEFARFLEMENTGLAQTGIDTLSAFLRHLQDRGMARSSMRVEMVHLRIFFRWLAGTGILPPFGAFYLQAEREYWKKTLPYFWKCPGRGCRFPMCWIRKPFQVCLKALTFKIFL